LFLAIEKEITSRHFAFELFLLIFQFKTMIPDKYKIQLECKANTLPILMHQMRISTTKVSSVVLRPEKSWKSENSAKEPKIPNTVP
jgi:hypothetical protein